MLLRCCNLHVKCSIFFISEHLSKPVNGRLQWDSARKAALVPGAQVQVFGLMGATEHNGKGGRVVSRVGSKPVRYGVKLEDGGSIAARIHNLRLV